MKQQHSSTLQPADVQKRLKEMADKRFLDASGQNGIASEKVYQNEKVCYKFGYTRFGRVCLTLFLYISLITYKRKKKFWFGIVSNC